MHRIAISAMIVALQFSLPPCLIPNAVAATEVFAAPKPDSARLQVLATLNPSNDVARQQIEALWKDVDDSVSSAALLDLVIRSFAIVDPDFAKLLRDCNSPSVEELKIPAIVRGRPADHPFFRANVGLFFGRYLVERRLYDEAWEVLKSIDKHQVVDPASLFFFQAVAAQGMLELKPALDAIDQLLTNTEKVPVRYSAAATLMQAELQDIQEKSLAEISRLMSDSERRLDLGRAGEKVQGVQERIISTLDEIIKKIEAQQNGGDGNPDSAPGKGKNQPANGEADSRVKGSEAPGETDKKQFENKGAWGNLPDKDVAKAKNDLNKNFPSHYEQAIEKYTKKLATRAAKKK